MEEQEEFYKLKAIDHKKNEIDFSEFRGSPLLISNVASTCGLAKNNYESFADLLTMYHKKGLRILLFPCGQYLNQELEDVEKIYQFISQYSEEFILFDKVFVFGKNIHPVFDHLVRYSTGFCGSFIKWNFTKFLINDEGKIVKRYGPNELVTCGDKYINKLLRNAETDSVRLEDEMKYSQNPYELSDSDNFFIVGCMKIKTWPAPPLRKTYCVPEIPKEIKIFGENIVILGGEKGGEIGEEIENTFNIKIQQSYSKFLNILKEFEEREIEEIEKIHLEINEELNKLKEKEVEFEIKRLRNVKNRKINEDIGILESVMYEGWGNGIV